MRHGTGTLVLAALLAPGLYLQAAPAARTPETSRAEQANETTLALRVETDARAMRPGEAVLVTVTPSRPVSEVRAAWFERPAFAWQDPGTGTWQGVVGIPVDAKPGTHILSVEATTPDGAAALERVRVRIAAARFATRRLRVNPRFLNPPASAAPRIAEESRVLGEVFAAPPTERAWRGPFSLPVPGPATSAFGRLSVVNGKRRGRHMGVDLRAAEGTPIHSPNHGVVVLAADRYMSGQTVVVDHGGGIFSLFAHLSKMAVDTGDRVERGALIGNAGATGRVTGPHLHWAVRVGGTTVDPLSLVAVLERSGPRPPASNPR